MWFLPLLAICLIPCFVLIHWYLSYLNFERKIRHIPGPKPLPVIGNALEFSSSTTTLPKLMHYKRIYGNFKIYIGSEVYVFYSKPADVQRILTCNKTITKSPVYRFFARWLGNGLVLSTGNLWRKRRKIITPAFHFNILEDFISVFSASSDILIQKLEKEINSKSFDISLYIAPCTLDIICDTAMGVSLNAQENTNSEYIDGVHYMLKLLLMRFFSAAYQYDFLYQFSELYRKEIKTVDMLHKVANDVIKKRRQEFLSGNANFQTRTTDDLGRKIRKPFLDSLLEYSINDPSFTDDDIREEVDNFLFAGYDTTATTMSFALHNIANHQEVQDKIVEEQRLIFSDDQNRVPTHSDLQNLKYLEMVLKETIRIYSTVPIFGRTICEDTTWEDGHSLPKGAFANIFLYGLHMDPETFPNPEKFDPERFSPENVLNRHPFAFLGFSAGLRNCIGQRFAMMQMKTIITIILRKYRVLAAIPTHIPILDNDAILKSANGIHIGLKLRT